MENTLSDYQGFDCLNVIETQIDWKSVYLEQIEKQKRRFIQYAFSNKESSLNRAK